MPVICDQTLLLIKHLKGFFFASLALFPPHWHWRDEILNMFDPFWSTQYIYCRALKGLVISSQFCLMELMIIQLTSFHVFTIRFHYQGGKAGYHSTSHGRKKVSRLDQGRPPTFHTRSTLSATEIHLGYFSFENYSRIVFHSFLSEERERLVRWKLPCHCEFILKWIRPSSNSTEFSSNSSVPIHSPRGMTHNRPSVRWYDDTSGYITNEDANVKWIWSIVCGVMRLECHPRGRFWNKSKRVFF